jgi:hypothetical protein
LSCPDIRCSRSSDLVKRIYRSRAAVTFANTQAYLPYPQFGMHAGELANLFVIERDSR